MNGNQSQVSYWLGSAILAQKDPAKQSSALWQFARAAAYEILRQSPGTKLAACSDLPREGIQQLSRKQGGAGRPLTQAQSLASRRARTGRSSKERHGPGGPADKEAEFAKSNPQMALWKSIKTALTGTEGASYFESNMKGAALPGGAGGLTKFTGKLIEQKPKQLILAIENEATADVTLNVDAPIAGKLDPGTAIGFEGVASGYTADPFMVTFDVKKAKLTGIKTAAPPPAKKAPARRPAGKKK